MQNPLAVGSKCGAFFRTGFIAFGDCVIGASLSNILVQCPYCGGIAQVIDGTYDAVDGILKFISGAGRHEYEDERREALEKWGAHVATISAG